MKKEAMYAEKAGADNVRCLLCPHLCLIKPGKRGICRVRKNVNGTLVTETYGKLSAVHIDPVEKKPLYHFYPGRTILSVGSIGCNMHCNFCQNWDISQSSPDHFHHLKEHFPEELAEVAAESTDNIGIAYTYNEPVVYFEMMMDTARLVHKRGKKNVAVTNAFIEPDPLEELIPLMDAFNVDLKAFDKEFYRKYAGARLEPVKKNLATMARSGTHLEITNLIIPGLNDQPEKFREMVKWIATELGEEVVLHLSRYFPQYKMHIPPTPEETMLTCYEMASGKLKYVYLGNMSGSPRTRNTWCPECGNLLIERTGYHVRIKGLDDRGYCGKCGTKVIAHH